MPILISKKYVQAMVPAHVFALINFLNQERDKLMK